MHRLRGSAVLVGTLSLTVARVASSQVYRVAEMNTEQIRVLDRERTVVLLPGGILEQHGPYLPCFTDGYFNEWFTRKLADAIVTRPGWAVLMFPTIPLGTGGANEIGRKYVFPGTFAVRSSTLRAVFMDIVTELGEQGFKRGFIIHFHGAPNHNRMLNQVSDFFHDTYGGEMVHLNGLKLPIPQESLFTVAEQEEDGFSVHAGGAETSSALFLRPDLVSPTYKTAPPRTGKSWEDLVRIARAPEWPGYFGSPRLATAARGAMDSTNAVVAYALKILDGLDPRQFRSPGDIHGSEHPQNVAIDNDALARERQLQRKQEEWLKTKGLEQE